MKLFKNKQTQDMSIIQGGFSDIRLWPCYMIYSSSILFFSPRIGAFVSFAIFTTIAVIVAVRVAANIPKVVEYDLEKWNADFLAYINEGTPKPDIGDYAIYKPAMTKKTMTKKVAKNRALWPYLDLMTN